MKQWMMGFKINETMVHPMSLCMPHFNIVVVVVFGEEKVRPVMFNDHHGKSIGGVAAIGEV